MQEQEQKPPVQLWDLPIRLTHWAIALLFACSWWTHEVNLIEWHMRSGYSMLTLVLFRLYWGVVGSSSARFSSFVVGPKAVWNYRRKILVDVPSEVPGHNPAGGWSVVAMLLLLLLQCCLGLLSTDLDGYYSGALSYLVDFDLSRSIAKAHAFNFNILVLLVGLHVIAVLYYLVRKRENLVRPMIVGSRRFLKSPVSIIEIAPNRLALLGLIVAGSIVGIVVYSAYL